MAYNRNEGYTCNNNTRMIAENSLSYEDAVAFVRDKLKVDDIEFAGKTFETLKRIQRHFLSEIPFQNITLISKPHKQRFPTAEDVLREGFSLGGGTCIDNNWFAYLILKALGYDAYAIAAIYCANKDLEDLHMMVIVKGLQDPDDNQVKEPIFLVDVASGYPLPAPVPLHRLPIIYPETAGLELCFKRYGDYIFRLHKDRDVQPDEIHPIQEGWAVVMKFNLDPRDPASLRKGMELSFLADPPGPFLQMTRLFRWPIGKEWAVAMRGTDLMFFGKECPEPLCHYDENKRKYKMALEEADLETIIFKYFPMISQYQLKSTLQIIQKYEIMKEENEKEENRKAEKKNRTQECS